MTARVFNKSGLVVLSLLFIGCSSMPNENGTQLDGEPASAENCSIEGHALDWSLNYCRLKTDIKNRHSKVITTCMEKQQKGFEPLIECQKRRKIKTKYCRLQKKLGRLEGGVVKCVDSNKNTPSKD